MSADLDRDPGPLPAPPYPPDGRLLAQAAAGGLAAVSVQACTQVAVVIGRGGRQDLELDTVAIARDRVPLFRRLGGGCSVVLDPGNVVAALVLPLPGVGGITSAFAAVTRRLISALQACGVPGVQGCGVSDLALGERKVGGACVYRTRGLLLYSTTLLVCPDISLAERYLRHPPREPQYRGGRPHRAFMGSLQAASPGLQPAALAAALAPALRAALPALQADLEAGPGTGDRG